MSMFKCGWKGSIGRRGQNSGRRIDNSSGDYPEKSVASGIQNTGRQQESLQEEIRKERLPLSQIKESVSH